MQAFLSSTVAGAIRYHDFPGEEPAILFLHGLGCASSSDFPRIAADAVFDGRRRLLVDLLGFGFSDRPLDFSYSIDDHAKAVASLLAYLRLLSVDLVGHSMGGAIAIVLASKMPTVVRRLVLSEPNLDPGGGQFSRPIAEQSEEDYCRTGHALNVRAANVSGNRVWAGSLMISSPVAVYRSAVSLVRGSYPSWREQLYELPHGRTVIFGAQSLPDQDTERLAMNGIAVRIVPNAGHSMMYENPVDFAATVGLALSG